MVLGDDRRSASPRSTGPPDGQHVGGLVVGVEAHVVVLAPVPVSPVISSWTANESSQSRPSAGRSRWTVVSRVPCGSRLMHHDHDVARGRPGSTARLLKTSTCVVVAAVDGDVAQLLQRRVRAPDLVEPGEVRRQRAALGRRRPPSRGSGSGTSPSRGTPRCPGLTATCSNSSKPAYTPQLGEPVAASTARILNAAGPPYCRNACRMSGVFTKKFGRIRWSVSCETSRR